MITPETVNSLENPKNENSKLKEISSLSPRFPIGLMANHPQKMVIKDDFDKPLDELFDFNQHS